MPTTEGSTHRIGLISDTHGSLHPEVGRAFHGVGLILHAGDVGSQAVLDGLAQIAPVYAVRGNMDRGELRDNLPASRLVDHRGVSIYLIHDLSQLDLSLSSSGVDVVVFGHTHQWARYQRQGVWYVNPGSAGRSLSTQSVGLLIAQDGALDSEFVTFTHL